MKSRFSVGAIHYITTKIITDIDGLMKDCSNSSASAMELLWSYTKPAI